MWIGTQAIVAARAGRVKGARPPSFGLGLAAKPPRSQPPAMRRVLGGALEPVYDLLRVVDTALKTAFKMLMYHLYIPLSQPFSPCLALAR
ncbi:hypothetical protein HA052_14700 [Chromobacterium haemolyticum]|uniref:Uncharacterized protein n=1 Tax=Chromobacterium fluminis TaxID=3044269 RepID=A0ABX0L6N2_9NEIS|nr:hypothetical protein [Chromobacterium haemolyticum]NHR06440.1 hypothetical protein [Chromobacterium haemolyticum]